MIVFILYFKGVFPVNVSKCKLSQLYSCPEDKHVLPVETAITFNVVLCKFESHRITSLYLLRVSCTSYNNLLYSLFNFCTVDCCIWCIWHFVKQVVVLYNYFFHKCFFDWGKVPVFQWQFLQNLQEKPKNNNLLQKQHLLPGSCLLCLVKQLKSTFKVCHESYSLTFCAYTDLLLPKKIFSAYILDHG